MEYTNFLSKVKDAGMVANIAWAESIRTLLLLLAPACPHIAEELWQRTGRDYSIHSQVWPEWDEELARDEEVTMVIQVNGKLRDRVAVPVSVSEAEARQFAMEQKRVQPYLEGKKIVNIIYVPGRLVNIVVK